MINFIIKCIVNSDYKFDNMLNDISSYVTQFVTIIIVAVPEGLPLTITISLAYSVTRMKDDGLLIKNLNSPEVNARINQIIIGKTGTLTKGDNLKVKQFYVQSKTIQSKRVDTLFNTKLNEGVIEKIQDSFLFNTEARIEMTDQARFAPVGNATEVALIKFLQDADIPVQHLIKRKIGKVEFQLPFSCENKFSIIAVRYDEEERGQQAEKVRSSLRGEEGEEEVYAEPEKIEEEELTKKASGFVRVFVKGSPESVLRMCEHEFNEQGEIIKIDNHGHLLDNTVSIGFTKPGLRTLAFAYRDYPVAEFEVLRKDHHNFESFHNQEQVFMSRLNLLAIFGMQDQIRPEAESAVSLAKDGKIVVRLVSGDHIDTAVKFAIEAGIITPQEAEDPKIVMRAEDFRRVVGDLKEDDGKYHLRIRDEFERVVIQ